MITDLTYEEFCQKYYLESRRVADITITVFIQEHGQLHSSLDIELIKDRAIERSLRKTYDRFDSDNKKMASIKTFLSTNVHNQVLTELRDESTAINAGRRDSLESYKTSRVVSGMDSPIEDDDAKTRMRLTVTECISKLDSEEQVVINCWMENQRNYSSAALSILGWGEERRSEVKALKERACAHLREMLSEYKPVTKEEKASHSEEDKPSKESDRVILVYNVPLKTVDFYADYVRQYFGLYHPSLEAELSLLDRDPDRTFKLYEIVRHKEIETAFDEGDFASEENTRRLCIELLFFVANIYSYNFYEKYKEHLIDQVSDQLLWEEVREDILRFYVFMKTIPNEGPISIKMGKSKCVIKNYDHWFQALMDNHLFHNCLPEIQSKEHALKVLKGNPGRKVESELAIAIITGIARLFADAGLISGRAPKNLCTFIKQYLVMMDILDLDYSVISLSSIKSTIDYALRTGKDTRLIPTGWETVSREEMQTSEQKPGERWLYSKG